MTDRTQQTLDDLADLFLTGTAPAAPAPTLRPTAPPKPRAEQREAPAQPLVAASKPTPTSAPQSQPQPQPATRRVEAVLLGNLPGMAHVWLTQYAQHVAEAQSAPVLLLTVDPDFEERGGIEAELVEPRVGDVLHRLGPDNDNDNAEPADWFAPFPQRRSRSEPEQTETQTQADVAALLGFDAARTAVAERRTPPVAAKQPELAHLLREHPKAMVLVHTDLHERELDRLLDVSELGSWTLLTGADPTAVAAARQGLQTLANADPQARTAEVGVFVVGSPQPKAHAAADAIADLTGRLFDAPVRLAGHLPQIKPAAVRTLGRYLGLDAQWAELIETLDQAEPQDAAVPEAIAAAPAADIDTPVLQHPEPTLQPEPEPQPEAEIAQQPEPPLTAQPVIHGSLLERFLTEARHKPAPAKPTAQPAPKPRAEPSEAPGRPATPATRPETQSPAFALPTSTDPDLPTLLDSADPTLDLQPLPVRCPEHPHLHLAADAAGRLHLLARLTDADHPRPILLALTDARRWATKHRELLALAVKPGDDDFRAGLNPDIAPILHCFTDQPDRVVPLAAAIDPTIRLHLLQHLPLDTGPTWLVTPLQTAG